MGVVNVRVLVWNRLFIDCMVNINMELGEFFLDDFIMDIEEGVYMEINWFWFIDDLCNKF